MVGRSDSTMLPQDPIVLREVAEVEDVEAAVALTIVVDAVVGVAVAAVSAIVEDEVGLVVAVAEAQTEVDLETSRARSRLSIKPREVSHVDCMLCQHCRT